MHIAFFRFHYSCVLSVSLLLCLMSLSMSGNFAYALFIYLYFILNIAYLLCTLKSALISCMCDLCVQRALMDFIKEFTTVMTLMILSVSSLHAAYQLFKVNVHSVSSNPLYAYYQ